MARTLTYGNLTVRTVSTRWAYHVSVTPRPVTVFEPGEFLPKYAANQGVAAYALNQKKRRHNLFTECKWDEDTVSRSIVLDLIENKTPLL